MNADEWTTWRQATDQALYGSHGFFRREAPAAHFRTSVHASPLFARAVAELLRRVDDALGHPGELALVDIGAGRGELLLGVLGSVPAQLAARLRPYAVEHATRPQGLDPRITWSDEPPGGVQGLLFANEWLDNVPVDVAEADEAGEPRYVLVRPRDGAQRLGGPLTDPDAAWLRRWWPIAGSPGDRAEIGLPRDTAWARAVASLDAGLAVAVDYAHALASRPPYGTLTGYRVGREVPPVPDGSCDITAHVALDACADAGGGTLTTQRAALRALGIDGRRPPLALASSDPTGYLRALTAAGQAAELTAPGGLGDFTWLTTPTGPIPANLLRPTADSPRRGDLPDGQAPRPHRPGQAGPQRGQAPGATGAAPPTGAPG